MARDAEMGKPIKIKAVRAGKKGIFFSDIPDKAFGADITEDTLEFKNPAVYKNQADAYTALLGETAYNKIKSEKPEVSWAESLEEQVNRKEVKEWWDRVDRAIIKEVIKQGHDGIVYHHGRVYCDGEYVDLRGYNEEIHKASSPRLSLREMYKATRIYIENPSDAPENAQLKRGPRGGMYYEVARREQAAEKPNEAEHKEKHEWETEEVPKEYTHEGRKYKVTDYGRFTIDLPFDEKEMPDEIDERVKDIIGYAERGGTPIERKIRFLIMGKSGEKPFSYKTREGTVVNAKSAADASFSGTRIRIFGNDPNNFSECVVMHEIGHLVQHQILDVDEHGIPPNKVPYNYIVDKFTKYGYYVKGEKPEASIIKLDEYMNNPQGVSEQFKQDMHIKDYGLWAEVYEAAYVMRDRLKMGKSAEISEDEWAEHERATKAEKEWEDIWKSEGIDNEYANRNSRECFAEFFMMIHKFIRPLRRPEFTRSDLEYVKEKNPKKFAFFQKYVLPDLLEGI